MEKGEKREKREPLRQKIGERKKNRDRERQRESETGRDRIRDRGRTREREKKQRESEIDRERIRERGRTRESDSITITIGKQGFYWVKKISDPLMTLQSASKQSS